MCPGRGVTRGVRGRCSSASLHGASSVALKSAPTHVNRFGPLLLFVELLNQYACYHHVESERSIGWAN